MCLSLSYLSPPSLRSFLPTSFFSSSLHLSLLYLSPFLFLLIHVPIFFTCIHDTFSVSLYLSCTFFPFKINLAFNPFLWKDKRKLIVKSEIPTSFWGFWNERFLFLDEKIRNVWVVAEGNFASFETVFPPFFLQMKSRYSSAEIFCTFLYYYYFM